MIAYHRPLTVNGFRTAPMAYEGVDCGIAASPKLDAISPVVAPGLIA
jgi:hypothetical protein